MKMINNLKIMIIGHGFVGKAVDYGFSHPKVEKTIVDPKYGNSIYEFNILDYDMVFICVPTPMSSDGSVDASTLDEILSEIGFPLCPVVIKSTVTPDIVYKYDNPTLVYNPEFLTEKSAQEQFVNPPFHIFGGSKNKTEQVEEYYEKYSLCNHVKGYHMTVQEASYVKYAINTFLATKVTFFNQLFDSVSKTDANFSTIIKAVAADPRIGPSHTKVPGFDGKMGYGGACFPKDVSALIKYDPSLTLLEKVSIINNEYRSGYDLDNREREQNVNYGQTKKELEDWHNSSPS